ncbi:DUF1801 domain-containing protein [Phaeovulum sp. W22_SRMD_FR3]|uniref:DUF1801 domain-containing protein n=1 Tax=Phaeovulum sp. W22_SRMD_FR3 TaxID=3240274 RepID=UPI003F9A37B5
MEDAEKAAVLESLVEMVLERAPDALLRPMYGGTVIELEPGNPQSRIGGFYLYAGHVSFEFAKGFQLQDPDALLEGTGKFRRHVKLRCVADIRTKTLGRFLDQAVALCQMRPAGPRRLAGPPL